VVSIFTAEYLLRLLVTANKCLFLRNPLNFVDLLSSKMLLCIFCSLFSRRHAAALEIVHLRA
jgi:hypothetical protein